jgi:hypothetical protein
LQNLRSDRKSGKIKEYDKDGEHTVKFSSSSMYEGQKSACHNRHMCRISINETAKMENVDCRLEWVKVARELWKFQIIIDNFDIGPR